MSSALRLRLCRDCQAGIYMVELRAGGPHPVDMLPAAVPLVGMVAVNPARGTGRVLVYDDIDTGRAVQWMKHGAQVHTSHFATCPFAQRERDHNPDQERFDV